ncbi:hypothetical protein F2Q69_00055613 [Brassica cretica]|uniref:Uncharacterized protein n=1 Tax=Brassica cretica TaxID=69181 RepID=A0A8S9N851_BRACR|nr:hypothetical protein F2Q69_00055613 [Brassica cretica]
MTDLWSGSRSARVLSTVVVRALQFRSVVPPSALFSSVPLSLHLLNVVMRREQLLVVVLEK